jgi:hypothetical protein
MDIIILLSLLQFKHYYADFVIQTHKQVIQKGIYRDWVGISHSLDHVWTSMVVLLIFSQLVYAITPLTILVLTIIEGVIHYHIDFIKVKHGNKDITTACYWNHFGLDQLAHQLTYLLMTIYIFNLIRI